MLEDRLLVFRFRLGDRDALRLLYEKYKNDLLKLAVVLVNDVGLAEDAVQDVFTNLVELPERVRIGTNIRNFLSTCVANRVRNLIRDKQRRETTVVGESDSVTAGSKSPDRPAEGCWQLAITIAAEVSSNINIIRLLILKLLSAFPAFSH